MYLAWIFRDKFGIETEIYISQSGFSPGLVRAYVTLTKLASFYILVGLWVPLNLNHLLHPAPERVAAPQVSLWSHHNPCCIRAHGGLYYWWVAIILLIFHQGFNKSVANYFSVMNFWNSEIWPWHISCCISFLFLSSFPTENTGNEERIFLFLFIPLCMLDSFSFLLKYSHNIKFHITILKGITP